MNNQFKKELRVLLKKYDATLMFDCANCSDLHSVYDERLVFFFSNDEARITKKQVLNDGYCCKYSDIH